MPVGHQDLEPGKARASKPEAKAAPEGGISSAGKDLQRLIVVVPTSSDDIPYLDSVFASAGKEVPNALHEWDNLVNTWCEGYRADFGPSAIVEVNLGTAVFLFDRTHERVVVAYGLSTTPAGGRDRNRMRSFPDVNVGIRANLGTAAFLADRGHFLSHAAGGELDVNLFPHRRELNRGWSERGKVFRRMEAYVADNVGTFHFHRATYDDLTWVPTCLEFGVLQADVHWWTESFRNK